MGKKGSRAFRIVFSIMIISIFLYRINQNHFKTVELTLGPSKPKQSTKNLVRTNRNLIFLAENYEREKKFDKVKEIKLGIVSFWETMRQILQVIEGSRDLLRKYILFASRNSCSLECASPEICSYELDTRRVSMYKTKLHWSVACCNYQKQANK